MADLDLQAYYARDEERDRLSAGVGRVEFLRTVEVASRTLPAAPAVVADIGGGPGYAHTPDQLREEIQLSGLDLESCVALEGITFALSDLDQRLDDPDERQLLLDTLRAHEHVTELLGLGPHLLATARKP